MKNNAAHTKYRKEKTQRIVIQLYKNTEQDIIEKINAQDNKSGYIKGLIKADIEK